MTEKLTKKNVSMWMTSYRLVVTSDRHCQGGGHPTHTQHFIYFYLFENVTAPNVFELEKLAGLVAKQALTKFYICTCVSKKFKVLVCTGD